MPATIKDIREHTGLSLATISKYLNGGNVLPENRAKIEAAIKELHYEVNEIARGLVTSKTKTVGVIVYSIESLFSGVLIRYIGEALRNEGYGLLICDSAESVQIEQDNVTFLLNKKVDGIIVLPVSQDGDFLKPAKDADIPVVLVDRAFDVPNLDFVKIDNQTAARSAVKLLLQNNHQKIAVISSDDSIITGWERYLGYAEAMRVAGLALRNEYVRCKTLSIEYGHDAMEQLLALSDPPTAVLLCNYEVTLGALMALNESEKRCPEDISMLGFDDLIMNHVVKPKMYTVVQPMKEMGEAAVKLMLDRIQKRDNRACFGISLSTTIKEGNSIRLI